MKKHVSILAMLTALMMALSSCGNSTTPATVSETAPPVSAEPIVETQTPVPALDHNLFAEDTQQRLEVNEFIGKTIGEVMAQYPEVAAIGDEWIDGSPRLTLSRPIGLDLSFTPVFNSEVYTYAEKINAVDVYEADGTGPNVTIGNIPRTITFNELKDLLVEYPDAYDSIRIDEDYVDEVIDGPDGPKRQYIWINTPGFSANFRWYENGKDEPADFIRLYMDLTDETIDDEVSDFIKIIGADSFKRISYDDPEYVYGTHNIYQNGSIVGYYSTDSRTWDRRYVTVETYTQEQLANAEREAAWLAEQAREEEAKRQAELAAAAKQTARSNDGYTIGVGSTVYYPGIIRYKGNVAAVNGSVVTIQWYKGGYSYSGENCDPNMVGIFYGYPPTQQNASSLYMDGSNCSKLWQKFF